MMEIRRDFQVFKPYEDIQDKWRKPLARKQLAKERRAAREAEREPVEAEEAILYVHSAEKGVTIPAHPENMFAVVRFQGKQVKVVKDDLILADKLPFEVGSQICLSEILMVGTIDYTALGRPTVGNARVFATIEEKSQAEKVNIFKKKRRKGHQKAIGHRQIINVLRIDRIEHDINEAHFARENEVAEDGKETRTVALV